MKIQDVGFLIIYGVLLWRRDVRWLAYAGLGLLATSIPLFSLWVFFTAQRFVWYAAACFLTAAIIIRFDRKEYA